MSYFCSRSRILLFHMCFGIRISSPFHLATQIISIQNPHCPKNANQGNHFEKWFLSRRFNQKILQCKTSLFRFLYNGSFHWKMFFSALILNDIHLYHLPILNTPWNTHCALLISNMQSLYSSNFTLWKRFFAFLG